MPSVEPRPALPSELRLGAPLLAQEASYLAASARMLSFSINCMEGYRYWFFVQYQAALPVTSAACQLAVASSKSCTERPLPQLRSFSYSDAAISSARIGNTESNVSLKPWLAWLKPCM